MERNELIEICDRCERVFNHSEAHAHLDVEAEIPGEGRYEDKVAFCKECNGAFVGLLTANNDLLSYYIALSALIKDNSR